MFLFRWYEILVYFTLILDSIINNHHDADGDDVVTIDSISVVDSVVQESSDEKQKHEQIVENGVKKGKLSHKQWRRYLKKMRRKTARQMLAREKERQEKEEEQRKAVECKIESEANAKLKEQIEKEEDIRKEKEHNEWLQREKIALMSSDNIQMNISEDVNIIAGVEANEKQEAGYTMDKKKELLKTEMMKLEDQQGKPPEQVTYHNPERINTNQHPDDWDPYSKITRTDHMIRYELQLQDPDNCKFFMKTGACRYGPRCSRYHVTCGNSSTIMIPNFFQNARLEISMLNENCNDIDIEYDELEMVSEFENFYYDVIEEFKAAGKVVMFKCCQNYVPHLRGNVYVQFSKPEYAMTALKMFNGRFYAGRQLSVEMSPVSNWKSSICGMFLKHTCPRGKACNFLHVFRNPGNAYSNLDTTDVHKKMNDKNQKSHSPSTLHHQDSRHRRRYRSRSRSPQSHSHGRIRSRSPRQRKYYRSHSKESRRSHRSEKSNNSTKSSKWNNNCKWW